MERQRYSGVLSLVQAYVTCSAIYKLFSLGEAANSHRASVFPYPPSLKNAITNHVSL